jgi:hypothetical protein
MFEQLHDCFQGLGKILESGLGKAFGFVLEGELHLALLAKCNDVLLGRRVKVNFVRHVLEVLHCKHRQL